MQHQIKSQTRCDHSPRVLLIHPPVYDFTAFDFYLYPLGLIHVADKLSAEGYEVQLLDALDRFVQIPNQPGLKKPTFRPDGCGRFYRQQIPNPTHLQTIPRRFFRFGAPKSFLKERLIQTPPPDAVAIGCSMTYWYLGVKEIAELVRGLWPNTKIILGGTYASLCPEHAHKTIEPDLLVTGNDMAPLLHFLQEQLGKPNSISPINPAHSKTGNRTSAGICASFGCPGRCPYCASFVLNGPFHRRPIKEVVEEISYCILKLNRKQIAFYDDALLDGKTDTFLELTEELTKRGLNKQASFHCPNAVRASAISEEVGKALRKNNFRTLRIGFETSDLSLQRDLGDKASNEELIVAIQNLHHAGFSVKDIGVYILMGLPDQDKESVEASSRFVNKSNALCRLAEYSTVPKTMSFQRAKEISVLDLSEPLNHNKTLAPFRFPSFGLDDVRLLKDLAHSQNHKLLSRLAF